jgi:hypothetical protein
LDEMKKIVSSGSKPLGTNALKNHIKSLRIEAAKAAALVSTVSRPCAYISSVLTNNHCLSSHTTSPLPPKLRPLCQQSVARLYTSPLH